MLVNECDNVGIVKVEVVLKEFMMVVQGLIKGLFFGGDMLNFVDFQIGGLLYWYYELEFECVDLLGFKVYYDCLCECLVYCKNIMVDFLGMKVFGV